MSTDWQSEPGAGEGLSPNVVEHPEIETTFERVADDTMVINMGPQHPSTHGVLRMIVTLEGEHVVKVEPVLGYLHRSMFESNFPPDKLSFSYNVMYNAFKRMSQS